MLVVLYVWIMAPYDLGQFFGWLVLCRLNQSNRYISFNLAILVIGANNSIESNLMMCLKCGAGCSNFEWLSIVIWMLKTIFSGNSKAQDCIHRFYRILSLTFAFLGNWVLHLQLALGNGFFDKTKSQTELTRMSKY